MPCVILDASPLSGTTESQVGCRIISVADQGVSVWSPNILAALTFLLVLVPSYACSPPAPSHRPLVLSLTSGSSYHYHEAASQPAHRSDPVRVRRSHKFRFLHVVSPAWSPQCYPCRISIASLNLRFDIPACLRCDHTLLSLGPLCLAECIFLRPAELPGLDATYRLYICRPGTP